MPVHSTPGPKADFGIWHLNLEAADTRTSEKNPVN